MDIADTLLVGHYAIYALAPPDKRGWNTLLQ